MTNPMDDIAALREKASMDEWWPRVEPLDVPTPRTETVELHEQEIEDSSEAEGGFTVRRPDTGAVIDAIEAVGGPPAFLRTDQASAKHRMAKASKIDTLDAETVGKHVWNVIEMNGMADLVGLPYKTFYVREWLDLASDYTAFTGTPIAPELRFFLLDGSVVSHGFYWPKDAIRRPDADKWEELHELTKQTALHPIRVEAAREYAETVADEFNTGYWSVDFALTEADQWYCIDMAPGEISWHPESCDKRVPAPGDSE